MESRLTKQKLLGEFLLEQQEPFALEVFLLERGCSRSLLNGSFVERPSSWKRRKGVIQLTKLLRTIQHQIGFFNGSFMRAKQKSGCERVGKCSSSESFSTSHTQGVAEEDGLSSPSSTTVYISCNESSDTEEDPNSQNKDRLESKVQERIQGNENFSFSSENQQVPPSYKAGSPVNTAEDSMVSASLQEILLHCLNQQVASCEYLNSKKGAQQTKRLLFDCVMEVTETHERKERAKGHQKGALGAEQIGRLICKRVMEWGGTSSRSGTSVTDLMYDHLLDDRQEVEWGDCSTQKMEIASGIADGILGDIRDEILADMSINSSL